MKKIFTLGLVITSVIFSGCSKHAIKQRPCACYDVEILQENKG